MILGLIPARQNSKRIPDKNIYPLNGHPLMAYSIQSALDSGIFERVIVSTDSEKYARIADYYGAEVIMRPSIYATDVSPDIQWVEHALKSLNYIDGIFSILRPTSPFRTSKTILRAWNEFRRADCDSVRAVELCKQHPYKMWTLKGNLMEPLIKSGLHSTPYQSLPEVYVQNASLEISYCCNVFTLGSISGNYVKPFFTRDYEGFDINTFYDLSEATWLIGTKQVILPEIKKEPYKE